MTILDFQNITAGYDEVVLKDITLKIESGEHWAILGANGSGKSTLLKLIQSDLHPRQNGRYKKEIFGESQYSIFDLKKKLGIITNDLHTFFSVSGAYLNGYEVILSGYYSAIGIFKYQGFTKAQQKKAEEIMAYLGIGHLKEKKVRTMSTGELRKCVVGRALVHDPKAFILDEPTVGLDIKAQRDFIQTMRKLSKNASIILVTHHLEEIFEEISHVALLHGGTVYKSGLKKEILNSKDLSAIFDTPLKISEKNQRYFIESVHEEAEKPI